MTTGPRGGIVSVGAALAVVAGLLQFASPVAVAAVGQDMPTITMPGANRVAPRVGFLTAADSSGHLVAPRPSDPAAPAKWISRDGSTKEVPSQVTTIARNGGLGLERVPDTLQARNVFDIRHYATNKVARFRLTDDDRVTEVFAENRLLVAREVGGKWTLHLLEMPAGGGQPVDRPVTGLADDYNGWAYSPASDKRGAAFGYHAVGVGSDSWRVVLLDFDSASVTYVPRGDFEYLEFPRLGAGDTVSFYAIGRQSRDRHLYVIDREHPQAPGHVVDLPQYDLQLARPIGGWVLYPGAANEGIVAVPVTGDGPARTVLAASSRDFVDSDDGSFFIEGGTDAEHWSVQQVTLGADGVPVFKPVGAPLPPVSVYEAGGVAVDQGRVLLGTERNDTFSQYPGTDLTASALSLTAAGRLTVAPPQNLGDLGTRKSDPVWGSECYGECLRFTGMGEGDISRRMWEMSIAAASASYTVANYGDGKQVWDGPKRLASGPWSAAALWGDTLWTARTISGKAVFERYSLPSMRKLGSLSVSSCLPSDLQVVGRYVYWSCGPNAQAVVYDQVKRTTQTVPRGYARLADGYLVSQDNKAGKLLITYLKGAVPAAKVGTKELGPLLSPPYAPADRRGRFWNVDRFGGPVAYTTASGDVTVKWPQVTTSPLAATDATVPTSVAPREGGEFKGVWHLNKPTANWKLTVTTSTGTVVRTLTGGRAHGKIAATWDGRNANGALVRAGTYRVTLIARTANGTPKNTVIHAKPLTVR